MNFRPIAFLALFLVPLVALAQDPNDPLSGERAVPMPMERASVAVHGAGPAYAHCGYATTLDAATLEPTTISVDVAPRTRATVAYVTAPSGAPASLLPCLTRAARGALSAMQVRVSETHTFVVSPFASLPRAPANLAAPQAALDATEVARFHAVFSGMRDDDARLGAIQALIDVRAAIPLAVATRTLRGFRSQPMVGAFALCQVATGTDVARSLAALLPARERPWFMAAMAAHCGVRVSAPVPGPDGRVAECDSNDDCALSCMHLPDCCGAPCGCGLAAPIAVAEEGRRACQAQAPTARRQCPAVACMRRESMAVCRQGRCAAIDEDEMLQGL